MVWTSKGNDKAVSRQWKSENPIESCSAIIHFIEKYYASDPSNDAVIEALLEDLFSKAQGIRDTRKSALMARAAYYSLPSSLRELYSPNSLGLAGLTQLPPPSQQRKNVGILTVINTELDALLKMFRVGPPFRDNNFEYWFSSITTNSGSELSVVITNVGQPRNVPCAIAVDHLTTRFPCDLMMLVGIAAGPPEKVKLGDVVAAERVYDYEHVRAEILQGKKVKSPRPLVLELEPAIRLDLNRFSYQQLKAKFESSIATLDVTLPSSEGGPALHKGTIAAGEMLIADGSLDEMRRKVDNEIRAGDQEDSGFAQACRLSNVPWCIFRGVSDYGTPEKDKTWHFSAAFAAAAAGYSFLTDAYTPSTARFVSD
jgi:nucleoside phosphorylase